ncbi:MAG: O-methyltransferase [Planctomycetota bacterium]|jgi:predicted O-methyltransferase YrrM
MLNFWSHYIIQVWQRQVQQHQRIALFGAGEHSRWLLDVVMGIEGGQIVGLIDDRAPQIREFKGLPVVTPEFAGRLEFDVIVISSDAAEDTLFRRAKACFPQAPIVRLYDGLPHGPYDKHGDVTPPIETIPGPGDTVNLDTVVAVAESTATKKNLIDLFTRLDPDPHVARMVDGYRRGIERFGSPWRYIDLWSMLYAYASLTRPRRYLEIGTRRGHSLAAVCAATMAAGRQKLEVVSCDQWIQNYAGHSKSGPDFVRSQLDRIGFAGEIRFLSGSSHELLPELFRNTSERFDLVTVDGDHSRQGALQDLEDVIDYVRLGGMLAFDDISHPQHPYLDEVWHRVLDDRPDFESYSNKRNSTGIAAAIRFR